MDSEETIKTSLYLPRSLLKQLKDLAFERRVSVTSLLQASAEALVNEGSLSNIGPRETPSSARSNVIDFTDYDPILGLIARLLRSDQAAHLRALVTYADEYINNHPECMDGQDIQDEAMRTVEKALELAARLPGAGAPDDPAKQTLRAPDKAANSGSRKRAG